MMMVKNKELSVGPCEGMLFGYLFMIKRLSSGRAALFILMFALILAGGCGDNARRRAGIATKKGWEALRARDGDAALQYFRVALAADAEYPEANYGMARVLSLFFFDNNNAIIYYKRYLDLATEEQDKLAVADYLSALQDISDEGVEDPLYAVEDFLCSSRNGDKVSFFERLSPYFLHTSSTEGKDCQMLMAEFGAFSLGGKPEIIFRDINRNMQAATVVVRIKPSAIVEGSCFQLVFIRGKGHLRDIWQLAVAQTIDV